LTSYAAPVAQAIAAAILGYSFSILAMRGLPALRQRSESMTLGVPERMLLAIAGFVAYAVVLMVGNIITGGAVFGTPWVVPIVSLGVIAFGARQAFAELRGLLQPRPGVWVRLIPWVIAAVVLGWLYLWPAIAGGSGARGGDVPSHLGWASQLLGGEPIPAGAAPDVSDNAYPWGIHAVMATLVRAVPGTDVLATIDALQILLVAALPLASACLARRVHPRAGWPAAACAAIVGGFGWLSAGAPDLVLSPSKARYGADLVVASPNSIYELFPPSLPRELGLVMLGVLAVVLLLALRNDRNTNENRLWAASGLVGGLTGLMSMPLFLCALVWIAAVALVCERGRRARALILAVPPALAVFALWVGPVVAGYVREDGFVDITAKLGIEWDLWAAIVSWGVLAPLTIVGVVLCRRASTRREEAGDDVAGKALLVLFTSTALLLALSYARAAFDWEIANNATILHMGRFWPPLHLVAAALGGIALVWLYRYLNRRVRMLGAFACVALLGLGAISPVFASIKLREVIEAGEEGYVYGDGPFAPGSFVREAAAELGPDDVLRVEGSTHLAYAIFQLSGVRLSTYDDPRFEHNDLRIRYKELAEEWDEVVAAGGFRPGYVVRPGEASGDALASGTYGDESWILIASP
jgi:hypothetical protein